MTWLLKAYLGFVTNQSKALEDFYKFIEKSEKCQTNLVGFRERNPTTFVILTWPDSKYFLT
jgi:predicted neutral ceramidase superfamily lipid hydrolase